MKFGEQPIYSRQAYSDTEKGIQDVKDIAQGSDSVEDLRALVQEKKGFEAQKAELHGQAWDEAIEMNKEHDVLAQESASQAEADAAEVERLRSEILGEGAVSETKMETNEEALKQIPPKPEVSALETDEKTSETGEGMEGEQAAPSEKFGESIVGSIDTGASFKGETSNDKKVRMQEDIDSNYRWAETKDSENFLSRVKGSMVAGGVTAGIGSLAAGSYYGGLLLGGAALGFGIGGVVPALGFGAWRLYKHFRNKKAHEQQTAATKKL